jgi:hypothetical protein
MNSEGVEYSKKNLRGSNMPERRVEDKVITSLTFC